MGQPLFRGQLRPGRFVRLEPYDDDRAVKFVESHAEERLTISEVLRVCIHIGLDRLYDAEESHETES
jgi:hypothetical protein